MELHVWKSISKTLCSSILTGSSVIKTSKLHNIQDACLFGFHFLENVDDHQELLRNVFCKINVHVAIYQCYYIVNVYTRDCIQTFLLNDAWVGIEPTCT